KPAGGPDLADGFGADVHGRGKLPHADQIAFGSGADSAQSGRRLIECCGGSRPAFNGILVQLPVPLSDLVDLGNILTSIACYRDFYNSRHCYPWCKRSKVAFAACAVPWASAGPMMVMGVSAALISWQQLGHFVKP